MTCCAFVAGVTSAAVAPHYSVALSCRVVGLPRATYYAWRARQPGRSVLSARARADNTLVARIRAIHQDSDGTYGSPRVHVELRAQGVGCGRKRVERLEAV